MQYLELAPPAPLSPVVQCFWFLRGDLTGAPPQTIVPDGRMEIILHLGEPFAEVDRFGVARGQHHALAAGQLTAPLRIQPMGVSDVVGIRLRPGAARCVLGGQVPEVGNAVTPLGVIAGPLAAKLTEAARRDDRPEARARHLATALAGAIGEEPCRLVGALVRALGTVRPPTVRDLAHRLGVSARTLERRVRQETGLSPRALRRVLRFRRAFRMLDRRPAGEWGGVASAAGYYDQAHLIREFRQFAGAPPSAFFRDDPALSRALTSAEEPAA